MTLRRPLTWSIAAFVLAAAAMLASALIGAAPTRAATEAQPVHVVDFDVNIDYVSERYLKRALEEAEDANATVVILQLDTPGGFLDATRSMVRLILESRVPVVVWVAPQGSQAASAGTFISAAAAYLAMAPATNIGAAAVVGGQGEDLGETLSKKATEDAAALMRSIAAKRDLPVEPLEATIFEAKSYSAEEAVELGIADSIEATLDSLLATLDGKELEAEGGSKVVQTTAAPIENVEMSLLERLLSFLANPNLVYLLITLGGLALVVELWSGGSTWVPGTLGIIALLLGFAGVGQLPFSWTGLALILLGIGFLAFELHAPGGMFFGVAGAICLLLGGIFLIGGGADASGAETVSLWLLIITSGLAGIVVLYLANEFRRSKRHDAYVSPFAAAALVGASGKAESTLSPEGFVHVAGEQWKARLEDGGKVKRGEAIRVERVDGLTLIVTPEPETDSESAPAQEA